MGPFEHLEQFRIRLNGLQACYRDSEVLDAMLEECGFEVLNSRLSGKRGDMVWHVAQPK